MDIVHMLTFSITNYMVLYEQYTLNNCTFSDFDFYLAVFLLISVFNICIEC